MHGAGPWTTVAVADTGVSIPAEQHGRLFELFQQVHTADPDTEQVNVYTRRQEARDSGSRSRGGWRG